MDDDTAAAIALYSAGWEPSKNAFYYKLNFAICTKDGRKLSPPFLPMLKLCLIALSKMCALPSPSLIHLPPPIRPHHTRFAGSRSWATSGAVSRRT